MFFCRLKLSAHPDLRYPITITERLLQPLSFLCYPPCQFFLACLFLLCIGGWSLYWACIFGFLSFHIYTCVVLCLVMSLILRFRLDRWPRDFTFCIVLRTRRGGIKWWVRSFAFWCWIWRKATCLLVICCIIVIVLSCFACPSCCVVVVVIVVVVVVYSTPAKHLVVIAFYLFVSVLSACKSQMSHMLHFTLFWDLSLRVSSSWPLSHLVGLVGFNDHFPSAISFRNGQSAVVTAIDTQFSNIWLRLHPFSLSA